jgi:ABC-type transport system involved in multi-copper enzyme maturation permease subunit
MPVAATEMPPQARRTAGATSGGVGVFSLAGMELRAGMRGPSFRLLAIAAAIVGWSVGGAPGHGVALSAWQTGEAAWRYLGFIVIAWMSFVAVQDIAARTDVLVYSKPQPNERIILSRFLASFAQILVALCVMYLFAIASRIVGYGGLLGFSAYFSRFFVSAGVLFFVAAASYAMALLARTPLAGAVVGIYWIMAMAGKSYLHKAVYPSYSQNVVSYILLGLFLLGTACWFHRYRRRGGHPPAAWVRSVTPLSLLLCLWLVWRGVHAEYDPIFHTDPVLDTMMSQNAVVGDLAPGFRLPGATGKLESLADYPGRILLITLWSPADSESTIVLDRLEQIRQQYGSRGVQPVAICLSEDPAAVTTFARGADVHYPVVHDWGTHSADKTADSSPMAAAYEANTLPHLVITDRRRRIREVLHGVDTYEGNLLERAIEARLAEEPE